MLIYVQGHVCTNYQTKIQASSFIICEQFSQNYSSDLHLNNPFSFYNFKIENKMKWNKLC